MKKGNLKLFTKTVLLFNMNRMDACFVLSFACKCKAPVQILRCTVDGEKEKYQFQSMIKIFEIYISCAVYLPLFFRVPLKEKGPYLSRVTFNRDHMDYHMPKSHKMWFLIYFLVGNHNTCFYTVFTFSKKLKLNVLTECYQRNPIFYSSLSIYDSIITT